jgi:hypothetical protein
MKDPIALMRTFTSVCCCILCAMSCACEGCFLFRNGDVESTFRARQLMLNCLKETERLGRDEKKQLLLDKFRSFKVRVTKRKKYKFCILAGEGDNMHLICKRGFCIAYNVSHWYVEDLVSKLKKGQISILRDLNHCVVIPPSVTQDSRLDSFAEQFGIFLTPEQHGSLQLPNSVPHMIAAAWMQYYFSLVGDHVPNSDHQIHLEPIPKKTVWEEYKFDMEQEEGVHVILDLNAFLRIWKTVFPYVKCRKYKSSCGHCNLCTTLSEKRRQYRDREGRQEVTNLFALHRLSIVGERRAYYDRRMEASLSKSIYLSTIADGMQQNHCFLPWYANSKMPSIHVKQHLQGILMHGHNMRVYRTYSNIGGGANLAIHTWLLSLEEYFEKYKSLPMVLYHQIDGGSENANAEMYGIAALLVASGLVDKVVITRLPVGHTHEDIDACFALIWKRVRDEFVLTASKFRSFIGQALKKKVSVEVIDLLVIPDYVVAMKGCLDLGFGRFAKEEWTQCQFIFEAVENNPLYPMNVKTTYRAYCQDEFVEIVEDQDKTSICGLIPQLCVTKQRPLPSEAPLNPLKSYPTGQFGPAPFILGSRALVDSLSDYMQTKWIDTKPQVAAEWKQFADDFPASDNSQDYVTAHPEVLHVPFQDRLFGHTTTNEHEVLPRERGTRERRRKGAMRSVEATSSVCHSGNSRKDAPPSRLVTHDVNGVPVTTTIPALNNVYTGREASRKASLEKRKKTIAAKKAEAAAAANIDVADNNVDDDASSSGSSSDDEPKVIFSLNEKVRNIHRLPGFIKKCNRDGTYDVDYDDGRKDNNMKSKFLVKEPKKKAVNKKRPAPPTVPRWEMEVVTEDWVDEGGLQASHVVEGKRQRKSPNYIT